MRVLISCSTPVAGDDVVGVICRRHLKVQTHPCGNGDETFTASKNMKEFPGLKEANLDIHGEPNPSDLMNEELMEVMAEAGTQKIDSTRGGVYDHRRAMRKDFSNQHVADVYKVARKTGRNRLHHYL